MTNPVEILLVEDSPDDVELTLRVLQNEETPIPIRVASDGAAALEYLFPAPDVPPPPVRMVVLDLKLPKVDGHEVLRRIKTDPRTASIPVVVLTSSQEERDLVKSYGLGTNSFVVKPLDYQQFTDAVAEIGLYWLRLNKSPVGP
jgi:two-component system response regulator